MEVAKVVSESHRRKSNIFISTNPVRREPRSWPPKAPSRAVAQLSPPAQHQKIKFVKRERTFSIRKQSKEMNAKSITLTYTVTPDLTAQSMGSGDMPVLATPAMVAMMENASMRLVAADLAEGDTTVGGHIDASHLRPSAIGAEIEVTATLTAQEGRKMTFRVEARDGGDVIGEATHTRFVVARERFLSKLNK